MLAIVCPGQGSQTPGFLSPWLELTGVEEQLTALSELAGRDLIAHGTTSDEETIKDTAIAQPLIVAAGLVTYRALAGSEAAAAADGGVVAGHSVGEITASAVAGALSEQDAMRLVRARANAMAEAAHASPTGMTAVVGGQPEDVAAAIASAGLTAANANGAGQVVAAGTVDQLQVLAQNPPERARVIPLKVAGAFHTQHMASAVDVLERLRPELSPRDPRLPLLSNFDGRPVASGTDNLDSLIAQVSRPVRWDRCMEQLTAMGVTGVLELAPAGTLVGLAKRGMRGTASFALKTPEDLEAARAFASEHLEAAKEN
ncbi:ACP S-malonyltransferase [Zhihengliuella flava]|uniref:[acyl-carrier-protein] S-malonyltransferase n=1 Tax=Zhihengliuella flava TaxID=1285193 RepID=A0A931GDG1_9MICC|nr:[acyl-carrier-protein] S-malonyltransferase [Zhihengliuella flava]